MFTWPACMLYPCIHIYICILNRAAPTYSNLIITCTSARFNSDSQIPILIFYYDSQGLNLNGID